MSALELQALGGRPLAVVAGEVAINRWMSAVALAIICYDTVLTLPEEIEFLWSKKWSDVKVLTYLNRFISFCFIAINSFMFSSVNRSLSNSFCEVVMISTGIAAYVCFAMSNWILLARTQALLGNHRMFRRYLLALYIILYLATGGLVIKTAVDLKGVVFYSKTVRSCGAASRRLDMVLVWIGPMVFETIIFAITVLKLYQKASELYALGSKLLMVLYRDGVCYYFIIIGLRIFTFVSWVAFPISLLFVSFFLLWAVMSIAITRLQINLRKAVVLQQPPDTLYAQRVPSSEVKTDESSVIHISRKNEGGVGSSTPDVELWSMMSTHHGGRSDYNSRQVKGAHTGTIARSRPFQGEKEHGRVGKLKLSTHSYPNEGVSPSTTRVVSMGSRMSKGVPITTDHSHFGSFQGTRDSAV
ncbi:hypothetical protein CPB86DRAFT_423819 [Serendipita vermifera]|nr:hypothetical protein CPB86DRAFT_423819 [Serendipita vermifera]